MACGGEGVGAVTVERDGLELGERGACSRDEPDELGVLESSSDEPDPPAEPLAAPLAEPLAEPVWVAAPMPNEAPRAPTIPRPARPVWSRLLRWRGVMTRPCPSFLCSTCERSGSAVSLA